MCNCLDETGTDKRTTGVVLGGGRPLAERAQMIVLRLRTFCDLTGMWVTGRVCLCGVCTHVGTREWVSQVSCLERSTVFLGTGQDVSLNLELQAVSKLQRPLSPPNRTPSARGYSRLVFMLAQEVVLH